ncbi:uncharacterized protein AKAME5_001329700 [Lates japonicus]|uniref:protein-serine/threonine phosphatase n=1 Tax=Lates japonicus TaxID=270547 RepID=A0AAD3MXW9_LATJO|nr:uncharacterized protein AKAME5_001329700 [Lates japonicus]
MYLENSEQAKVSGEGEPSAEAMLAEQCQVPKLTKAADLTGPSKGSAELGVKVLVEYTEETVREMREMDSSLLCVEHCNMSTDECESCTYCNGHAECFEQYSGSNGFFESDRTLDKCETSGLSQPSDECAQHCECFKPCKSSEQSANHSLASKCCPCCEHCAEHLQLFQQCKPSGQQFESFDSEPDKLAMNSDSFGLCEMSDFTPGSSDHLEILQQYEPADQQCECFDSEPDTSTEDSEQCEETGFTSTVSDSVDLSDCGAELCANDDDVESYESEQNETEASDEESCRLSEDVNFNTPVRVYFDDDELVHFAGECCEKYLDSEESTALDMSTDHCEMCGHGDSETSKEYETTQQCATSDKTSDSSEFCTEEDGSSDCSSIETKSFKTCPDGSIPSDPYSDSSGESEKGAQEDSSDEQTQWESFEDDEEIEQSHANESNEDKKKTPTVDIVIEDYFDLFDRADYYGHTFAQKQRYISCFDGGDMHDCLYLEEEARKHGAKHACTSEEINKETDVEEADVCFDVCSEEACEEAEDSSLRDDCETEKKPEDWIKDSESSLAAEEEEEENECDAHDLYTESYDEAEEDENAFDGETCAFEGHGSEICTEEEAEVRPPSGNEDSMCAPCAEDISVEGDAYEDEVCEAQNHESPGDDTSTADQVQTTVTDEIKDDEPEPEDQVFNDCSEMELYWSLIDKEDNGEMCEPGVEDYYAYQIKNVQSSFKQTLNGLIMEGICDEVTHGSANEDALLSLKETQEPAECKAVRFTEVTELSETLVSEQTPESDDDCGLNETSTEMRPPLDIIHSVVSETQENKASEQSRDSEEELSDDEEPCECDHCIPPTEQVPAKPLLPQMQLNDAGKICVVIDLDETLVHSSFKPVNNADFIIPVEIDGTVHQVYVLKRPHVDEFLKRMGELFECVLFTASLAKYADPVSDLLDKWGAFRSRLFRESCVFHKGNYVKDLSRLGRDLNKVIIIDNSPASYIFHPDNAVPVASWFDDMSDTELLDLIPFFERLSKVDDIYDILQQQRTSS